MGKSPFRHLILQLNGFIEWRQLIDRGQSRGQPLFDKILLCRNRNAGGLRWLVWLGTRLLPASAVRTQFASWAQQKQIWGLCLYVSQKCAKPTFCVCIFLYLFIIIANVYFNVQISAKYTTHNSTILNFGIILKR